MLSRLSLPTEVSDWAMAYLEQTSAKDTCDAKQELQKLNRRANDTQATLDSLLLRAAQTENDLAEGFLRLARQKQEEARVLRQRIEQIQAGRQADTRDASKTLELAQHLSEQYLTFPSPQKRQIADSVFLNLRLDDVTLCGEHRLPFAILAENGRHPVKSGRVDLNHRPLAPHANALAKLSYAPNSIPIVVAPARAHKCFFRKSRRGMVGVTARRGPDVHPVTPAGPPAREWLCPFSTRSAISRSRRAAGTRAAPMQSSSECRRSSGRQCVS